MTTENQAPEGADLRAAAQQAADALEKIARHFGLLRLGVSTLADSTARSEAHAAIEALRAALAAQPKRDPSACIEALRGHRDTLPFGEVRSAFNAAIDRLDVAISKEIHADRPAPAEGAGEIVEMDDGALVPVWSDGTPPAGTKLYTQPKGAPTLPASLIQRISEYGDARADDGDSGQRLGAAIEAIRAWGATLAAPCAAPAPELSAKAIGYMNAGQLLELSRGGAPYGYVYPEERPGASTPVYVAPQAPAVKAGWQPMGTAPKDGTAILVLLEASDVPHAVRWDCAHDHGWLMTWDNHRLSAADGPRYWMPCPDDPDEVQPPVQGSQP